MANPVVRWERQPDGSLHGYDAEGNMVARTGPGEGGLDPHAGGADVANVHTDPMTGQTYHSDDPGDGWGPRGDVRGDRQAGRKQEEAQRQSRTDYYGGNATSSINAIDDPWAELAGNIPTIDQLAGPELTSELGGAQADRGAIEAQRAALRQLEHLSQGGRTAAEEAALQKAQSQTRANEKQQRDAIMQQAALRGMQGAGTTLGAQLGAQQAGANRYSQAQMDAQAMAEQRALQAMQARGQMGSQMRGQSFSEDATRRSAVDDFARWNAQGKRDAHRDQFAQRATTAQGQSTASATQAEQNRAMMENAQGQKTTTEKRYEQGSNLITGLV